MSIINDIEIKNFKSIRHQKIEGCKRINVFVGPPNVGKSNILEGLGLFAFSSIYKHHIYDLDQLLRINQITQLFFEGDINNGIDITLNNKSIVKIEYKDSNLDFEISEKINLEEHNGNGTLIPTLFKANFNTDKKFSNSSFTGRVLFPTFDIRKYFFKEDKVYTSNSVKSDNLNMPYGQNLSEIIFSKKELKKEVQELLKIYNLKISFDNTSNSFKVIRELSDETIFILDINLLADTLQRLIFHLAVIMSNKNSILLIEEPEAHCYEPYILNITNAIKNDKNENQFFIVTHSQYVIDELMRDEESRNDTNIYLVGLENNETKIKLLSAEASKDAYQTGLNLFFNYQTLWDEN